MFNLQYAMPQDAVSIAEPVKNTNWQLTHIEGVITMQGEAPQEIIDILNRLYTKEK
jgi:hypothetical protein